MLIYIYVHIYLFDNDTYINIIQDLSIYLYIYIYVHINNVYIYIIIQLSSKIPNLRLLPLLPTHRFGVFRSAGLTPRTATGVKDFHMHRAHRCWADGGRASRDGQGWSEMMEGESLRSKTMERSSIFMGKITIFIGKITMFIHLYRENHHFHGENHHFYRENHHVHPFV